MKNPKRVVRRFFWINWIWLIPVLWSVILAPILAISAEIGSSSVFLGIVVAVICAAVWMVTGAITYIGFAFAWLFVEMSRGPNLFLMLMFVSLFAEHSGKNGE